MHLERLGEQLHTLYRAGRYLDRFSTEAAVAVATVHPSVEALYAEATPVAKQLQHAVNHTMYVPVDAAFFQFDDPIKFGNGVYAQVVLMLSEVLNASFQKVVGTVAAR